MKIIELVNGKKKEATTTTTTTTTTTKTIKMHCARYRKILFFKLFCQNISHCLQNKIKYSFKKRVTTVSYFQVSCELFDHGPGIGPRQ